VIRTRFHKEIQEETVHHLVEEHLEALLKEKGWHMVGDPDIEGETVEAEKDSSVQVHLHILPSLQVPDFGGIEVKDQPVEVADDEVTRPWRTCGGPRLPRRGGRPGGKRPLCHGRPEPAGRG